MGFKVSYESDSAVHISKVQHGLKLQFGKLWVFVDKAEASDLIGKMQALLDDDKRMVETGPALLKG